VQIERPLSDLLVQMFCDIWPTQQSGDLAAFLEFMPFITARGPMRTDYFQIEVAPINEVMRRFQADL
jgi:hypothetical protein